MSIFHAKTQWRYRAPSAQQTPTTGTNLAPTPFHFDTARDKTSELEPAGPTVFFDRTFPGISEPLLLIGDSVGVGATRRIGVIMSGHNKWSTIKHKKAAADAKRGKVFTKVIKELTVAARAGGGDPDANPRLRSAMLTAKAANMPKDTMVRAIKKGAGELGGADYMEVTYEGYGPGGIAVFVETLTDNKNRTVGDVRHTFTKYNGNLGQDGSVAWMFDRKGQVVVAEDGVNVDEDQLFEVAAEAGADDLDNEDGVFFVTCESTALYEVRDAIETAGFPIREASLAYIPQNTVEVEPKHARTLIKLLDLLEENDDVQNVYHNAELTDDVLAELE